MEQFNWDDEKNNLLKASRNMSFEQVLDCFENGNFFGVYENPSSNFSHQEVFLVKINDYPCIVPFTKNKDEIFLKTIIPDRRFKQFIKE
ncbi:MAG: toxin [Bdellovibrionales bacterium]|nr:toxin [Bdellovibrionales bacterium]